MTRTLADLPTGASATLAELQLPPADAERLMAMGFIPGVSIRLTRRAPGGDPIIFQVDGAEVAIRRTTARHLLLRDEP
ncbi:MAG TPA: FeoA family protein [Gemmatimonadales bacterium]|nr:FeoA family protein [Gemmatimonadales bacterium]